MFRRSIQLIIRLDAWKSSWIKKNLLCILILWDFFFNFRINCNRKGNPRNAEYSISLRRRNSGILCRESLSRKETIRWFIIKIHSIFCLIKHVHVYSVVFQRLTEMPEVGNKDIVCHCCLHDSWKESRSDRFYTQVWQETFNMAKIDDQGM